MKTKERLAKNRNQGLGILVWLFVVVLFTIIGLFIGLICFGMIYAAFFME